MSLPHRNSNICRHEHFKTNSETMDEVIYDNSPFFNTFELDREYVLGVGSPGISTDLDLPASEAPHPRNNRQDLSAARLSLVAF